MPLLESLAMSSFTVVGLGVASDVVAQLLEFNHLKAKQRQRAALGPAADSNLALAEGKEERVGVRGTAADAQTVAETSGPGSFSEYYRADRGVKITLTRVANAFLFNYPRLLLLNLVPVTGGVSSAAIKTALNELVIMPGKRLATLAMLHWMEHGTLRGASGKLGSDFFVSQGVAWLVFPAAQFATFLLLPHDVVGQFVLSYVVGFGYDVFFAFLAFRKSDPINDAVSASSSSAATVAAGPAKDVEEGGAIAARVPQKREVEEEDGEAQQPEDRGASDRTQSEGEPDQEREETEPEVAQKRS